MLKLFERKSKGFTLIELLVVISIIGILSSIVLVSMGGARAKARDAARQSDMRQIGTACELFTTDNTSSSYPSYANYAALEAAGIGVYMSASGIPSDPGSNAYTWIDNSADATRFCVYAQSDDDLTWFAASHKGARMDLSSVPANLDCW